MRTGFYVVKAQSACCSIAQEVWTVRAKSVAEARKRVHAANGGHNIYQVKSVSGSAWRHFVAPMGLK